MKTRILAASAVLLTGILLVVCWASGDPSASAADTWQLGGCWIETCAGMDGATVFTYETLTPADLTGEVFTYRQSYVNADPTLEGLLPEADLGGELLGTAIRTGPDTYEYTVVGHAAKSREGQRPEILAIIVFSGKMTLTGPETREDTDVFAALYGPEADIDPVDGLPDEGVEPLLCIGPMEGSGRRVGLMPPCTPTPMPQPQQ
jgi:hypothetical protein